MSEYRYKMVNGELIELTAEEISELEERDKHPPPPDLVALSRRQFFQVIAMHHIITNDEALAAVQHGQIPQKIDDFINSMPSQDDQFTTRMLLSGASEFERTHPLVSQIGQIVGLSEAQIDDLWQEGSTL